MGQSSRQGVLKITLQYPATAFLYRTTRPRLRLDGVDVPVSGWGVQRMPVTPGEHQVEVWIPYILPRRAGRATCDIEITKGKTSALIYVAPVVTFARGSLGVSSPQTSRERTKIKGLRLIVAIAAVAALVVLVLT